MFWSVLNFKLTFVLTKRSAHSYAAYIITEENDAKQVRKTAGVYKK